MKFDEKAERLSRREKLLLEFFVNNIMYLFLSGAPVADDK